MNLIDMKKK